MKAHVEFEVQLHIFLIQQHMHLSDFFIPDLRRENSR